MGQGQMQRWHKKWQDSNQLPQKKKSIRSPSSHKNLTSWTTRKWNRQIPRFQNLRESGRLRSCTLCMHTRVSLEAGRGRAAMPPPYASPIVYTPQGKDLECAEATHCSDKGVVLASLGGWGMKVVWRGGRTWASVSSATQGWERGRGGGGGYRQTNEKLFPPTWQHGS